MRKMATTVCVFLALLLALMTFVSVSMLRMSNEELPTDTEQEQPSGNTGDKLIALNCMDTPVFNTYRVNLYITSNRDDFFFTTHTDACGVPGVIFTDIEANKTYLYQIDTVDSIDFDGIDGNYYLKIDGVRSYNATSVKISKDTVIELVLY